VLRGGRSVLDGTLSYPVALTLFSAKTTGDSLRGRVHADSVDLALVEALSTKLRNSTGRLALDLTLSGAPDHPHVGGVASVRGGGIEVPDVGMRLSGITGEISVDAARDSLTVNQLRWTSPASGGGASLQGSVVFRDLTNPRLDLKLDARQFRMVDKRGLARLDVSTGASGLTLAGTPDEATLSGAVIVDRGTIFIPELVRKQIVDLTPDDLVVLEDGVAQKVDTFQEAVAPVSVVLALDASGSMIKAADGVRTAALSFVDALRPEDALSVLMFADASAFAHGMTTDRQQSIAAVNAYFARGGTALYDGLTDALMRLKQTTGRKVVVLLSDGRDEDNAGTGPGSARAQNDVFLALSETDALFKVNGNYVPDLARLYMETTGRAGFFETRVMPGSARAA